jgi:hypothetical protein
MRRPWDWLRSHPRVALLATAVAAVAVVFVSWPRETVTRANFQRIQVGMSQAELWALFGRPEYDTVELGLVPGPETFTVNFDQSDDERHRRGFRNYRRQQWTSREITIVVISEPDGGVVCRYSCEGQWRGWREFLRSWVSRLF